MNDSILFPINCQLLGQLCYNGSCECFLFIKNTKIGSWNPQNTLKHFRGLSVISHGYVYPFLFCELGFSLSFDG